MNRPTMFAVLPALLLAACSGGGDSGGNDAAPGASPATSAATGGDARLAAGQWEGTSEVLEMAMPGMPAGMLKDAIGRKTSFSNCVTPEQAARDPGEMMLEDKPGGANCTRERFSMAGGTLDAAMTCSGGEMPGTMHMDVTGRYAPDSYETTVTITSDNPPGAPNGGSMRIVSKTMAKRVGPCEGSASPG